MELIVGQKVTVNNFSYINKHGGTGLSKGFGIGDGEIYDKPIKVKITKAWKDYECGYRAHAIPDIDDSDLIVFLDHNAQKGYHKTIEKKGFAHFSGNTVEHKFPITEFSKNVVNDGQYRVYIGEFDVIGHPLNKKRYYALWDNQTKRHMATGMNTTSKEELKESMISYLSADRSAEELDVLDTYTADEIASIYEFIIEESETIFIEEI